MNGNGCAGSIDSGVRTGNTSFRKVRSIARRSAAVSLAERTMWMRSPASASCSAVRVRCWSACRLAISASTISTCSAGVRPSMERLVTPPATCAVSPATRTITNSSRLAAEIDRKRTRSSSGCRSLFASSSTRRLNWSHENSRFTNRSGEARMSGSPAGAGVASASVEGSMRSFIRSN